MLPALFHPALLHPVAGLIPWLDPQSLIKGFGVWALVVVCAFVFAETGLLVGFVLPGDTLLVIAGVLAFPGAKQVIHIDIWWVCLAISAAAFAGGEVGYLIGRKAGPRVFERKESGFFSRRNVERTNAFFVRFGGLAVIGFCLIHGATFLALKSDGPVRVRSRRIAMTWSPIALLPIVGWVLLVQFQTGGVVSWILVAAAVVAVVLAWLAARRNHEGRAFIGFAGFLALGAASIFAAVYPVVLPSTINHAYDLTVGNASSSAYTLGVMTIVACCALPVVLVYQAWTYWVFRKRITAEALPAAHDFEPAIKR